MSVGSRLMASGFATLMGFFLEKTSNFPGSVGYGLIMSSYVEYMCHSVVKA